MISWSKFMGRVISIIDQVEPCTSCCHTSLCMSRHEDYPMYMKLKRDHRSNKIMQIAQSWPNIDYHSLCMYIVSMTIETKILVRQQIIS